MANWQRTLNLIPEWDQAKEHTLAPQQLAGVIAARLKVLRPFGIAHLDDERNELVEMFEATAENEIADDADIDGLMRNLYDWADTPIGPTSFGGKRCCWVKTF